MAAHPARDFETAGRRTLDAAHLLMAGAATAVVIFVVCWLGTLLPFASPTHAYIAMFTNFDTSSYVALIDGSVWSLLFGGLGGALFAVIYNAAGKVVRR